MANSKLVQEITQADLPLELADKLVLEELKQRDPVYIKARQLKSFTGVAIAEDFAGCEGVVLLDDKKGALAHNRTTDDPDKFLTGKMPVQKKGEKITLTHSGLSPGEAMKYVGVYKGTVENPVEIFGDTQKVLAIHVYHRGRHSWGERMMRDALESIGIGNIVHIPMRAKKLGKIYWRHIAVDVPDRAVYVFPTDFENGIKYRIVDDRK